MRAKGQDQFKKMDSLQQFIFTSTSCKKNKSNIQCV